MEPTTVIGCVSALSGAFAEGLEYYTYWKAKRSRRNHYRRSGPGGRKDVVTCALSTSLGAAEIQIKETYDMSFSIFGSDFSTGDGTCRDLLCNQLFNLRSRVSHLRRAAESATLTGTLNIPDLIQTSESARVGSIQALAGLYRRLAAGRSVPRDLRVPKPRPQQRYSLFGTVTDDDEDRTTIRTVSTEKVYLHSEPPSPPLTPKTVVSDAESTISPSEPGSSIAGNGLLCPKVSVFSMFCPEAMMLQVDLSKPVPEAKKCECGYRWEPLMPGERDSVILKEGFRMSRRFLAKSHSDKHAFGCILCVSSGKTETYDSPTALSIHINSTHTKWQILHERDID